MIGGEVMKVEWAPLSDYDRICPRCFARVLVGEPTGVIDIAPCPGCEAKAKRAKLKKSCARGYPARPRLYRNGCSKVKGRLTP